jgi:hypothetical protein
MPIWKVRFHGEFGGGGGVPRTSRNGEHDRDQILDLSRASHSESSGQPQGPDVGSMIGLCCGDRPRRRSP